MKGNLCYPSVGEEPDITKDIPEIEEGKLCHYIKCELQIMVNLFLLSKLETKCQMTSLFSRNNPKTTSNDFSTSEDVPYFQCFFVDEEDTQYPFFPFSPPLWWVQINLAAWC